MKKIIFTFIVFLVICCIAGCGSRFYETYEHRQMTHVLLDDLTFDINNYSSDSTYGFTEKNPILVGGIPSGPSNERRFLNALAGPKGETVFYHREGSCCMFKSARGFNGTGFLDLYLVQYVEKSGDTIRKNIYMNMYDTDSLKIPVGFTKKQQNGDIIYYSGN